MKLAWLLALPLLLQAQNASGATFSLGASASTVPSTTGTGTEILVAPTSSSPWTATSNASWLHLTPSSVSGTGSAVLSFTYDANTGSPTRTGTLTIAGLSFTVNQIGSAYTQESVATTLVSSGITGPSGIAVDAAGNVFFSDPASNTIKEWVVATRTVKNVVTGLNGPYGVALDFSGNLFYSQTGNNAIGELAAGSTQAVQLVSGCVASVCLSTPLGIAADQNGSLFIANSADNSILLYNGGSLTKVVASNVGLVGPSGVAVDKIGNLYIADTGRNQIEVLLAGQTQIMPITLSGTALNAPLGVAADAFGNLYIADSGNNQIREVVFGTNTAVPVVSSGLSGPSALVVDPFGDIFVADTSNNAIEEYQTGYLVTTAKAEPASAGTDTIAYLPAGLTVNAVSDQSWLTISGAVNGAVTFAFAANSGATRVGHITVLGVPIAVTQAGAMISLGRVSSVVSAAAGAGTVELFISPATQAWVAQSNASWITLASNSISGVGGAVVQFTFAANTSANPRTGTITIAGLTFTLVQAGSGYVPYNTAISLITSGLNLPTGLAADASSNLYIADPSANVVYKWTASTSTLSTFVSGLNMPNGVAVDAQGNVFIADTGNNAVKELPAGATQTITLVSTGLNAPTGVAVDTFGNVYIADSANNAIEEYVASSQTVASLVSTGLNHPTAVAVDALGNVYFTDTNNNVVKKFTASTRVVTVLIATGLNAPQGLAIDGLGNLYVADTGNNAAEEFNAATGTLMTAFATGLSVPSGITVDAMGHVYVSDTGNNAVKEYAFALAGPLSKTEGPNAVTDSVQILPNSLVINAVSNQTWLTVANAAGVNGVISFTLQANTAPTSRVATICLNMTSGTCSGPTVTVTQTAATFNFSLNQLLLGPDAGSSSLGISVVPATAGWTVSVTSNGWLTGVTPASGAGSALVTLMYGANTSTTPQTATLTVTPNPNPTNFAGQSIAVTQVGMGFLPASNLTTVTATGLPKPTGVAVDGAGNIYVADSSLNQVFKWAAPSGPLTTVVATGLNFPQNIALDSAGDIFIADTGDNTVKEWIPASSTLVTVASGLNHPHGVAVDAAGNLYIADSGNNQILYLAAGSTQPPVQVVNNLNAPYGLALDPQGVLYIADSGDGRVYSLNAGTLSVLVTGLAGPASLYVDGQENVYVADSFNNQIKVFNALVTPPITPAVFVSSGLNFPTGVTVDLRDNVFISDTNNGALKEAVQLFVSPGNKGETSAAGTDTLQYFPATSTIAATSDQTWLTITSATNGVLTFAFQANLAGTSRIGHIIIGALQVAVVQGPDVASALIISGGNNQASLPGTNFTSPLQVTVTDAQNNPLQGVNVTFATVAGGSGANAVFNGTTTVTTNASGIAISPSLTANGTVGTFSATASTAFTSPATFTLSISNPTYALGVPQVLVPATGGGGSVLLSVTPAQGTWTAVSNASWLHVAAGSASGTGSATIFFTADANATTSPLTGTLTIAGQTLTVLQPAAGFANGAGVTTLLASGETGPVGVTTDSLSNVYISDTGKNAIEELAVGSQTVTPLVTTALNAPDGIAVDAAGNVYFADSGNNAIKEWVKNGGAVNTLVSTGLSTPRGLAIDAAGNLYFADSGNNAIKEFNAGTSQVSVLVSSGLNAPYGVAVDAAGNVYFADSGNNAIKVWSATTQLVATLVSTGLSAPSGVTVDGQGNVFIADTGNNAVKQYSPAAQSVITLVSFGLAAPRLLGRDIYGNVYVADTGNNAIREITFGSIVTTAKNEMGAPGTDTIDYYPASNTFAVTSDSPWLTVTSVSNGVITFAFTLNTQVTTRTGHILALGQTIPVSQAADTATQISITAGNNQTGFTGGVYGIPLQVTLKDAANNPIQGAGVLFQVTPGANGASGVFATTPPMPVLTNANGVATAPALTANIVLGTFTVTASSGSLTPVTFTLINSGPQYALSTQSLAVGAAAGNGSVLLTVMPSSAGWTASPQTSWLHLGAQSISGTGNKLIQFAFDANPNATSRTGTILIEGITFTVTQAGNGYLAVTLVTSLVGPASTYLPVSVGADGQGNVYFADTSTMTIYKIDALTLAVMPLVTGINGPYGIAVDTAGDVYFTDTGDSLIKELAAGMTIPITLVSSGLNHPEGLAVDAHGNVIIADTFNNAIKMWSPSTNQVTTIVSAGVSFPQGVAVDAAGDIFIADTQNSAVKEWNSTTLQVVTIVSTGLFAPQGVAVDGSDNIYISDTGNNAIKLYNSATQTVSTLTSVPVSGPQGIALDVNHNLYIADTGESAVKKVQFAYLLLSATSKPESAAAGTDSVMLQVLPNTTPINPVSDQPWLTITSSNGASIVFAFTANTTGSTRTAHISVLGQLITVTQTGITPVGFVISAGNNQTANINQPFATPLQVTVTDASGLPVVGAGVTFTVVPGANGAGATFASGSMPVLTDVNGVAAAPVLTANNTAGVFTVTATLNNLSQTFTLTNSAGNVSQLVFTQQPANGFVGSPLGPLVVQVQDGNGNIVSTSTAAITLAPTGPGGFSAGSTTTVNAVGGVATFSNLVFAIPGAYTLTASSAGLASATSAPFAITSAPPATLNVQAVPAQSTIGQLVTLKAIISPNATPGQIAFYDGSTFLGSSSILAGQATLSTVTLGAGKHTLFGRLIANGVTAVSSPTTQIVVTSADGGFGTAAAYVVGSGPQSIAYADFNGDGKADVVTGNAAAGNISVLLSNGDGTFGAATNFNIGATVTFVTVTDLNGDGKADVVVGVTGDPGVYVLLGNGDGTFATPVGYAAGSGVNAMAVSDVNNDGRVDVIVSEQGSGTVGVLLGNGDGTLQALATLSVPSPVLYLVTGDFNGDGKTDIAVTTGAGPYSLNVLLGNGDGTFQTPSTIALQTSNPSFMAVSDLNGDGKLDLAIANTGSNSVSVIFGNGNGTFQNAVNYLTPTAPQSIAVGDFNGDGTRDLAVANNGGANVSVLLNTGAGAFSLPVNFAVGGVPTSLVATDFNGDGHTDLAVTTGTGNAVAVLLGASVTITPTQGTPQTAVADGAFATPLGVSVTSFGQPAAGVPITFSVPLSGASAAFAGAGTSAIVTTGTTGLAVAPQLIANNVAGAFGVTASFGQVTANFALTNGASSCTFSVSPGSISFDANGGTTTVTVMASSPTCGWGVASSATFISSTPSAGPGSGTVTVTIPPNQTGAARTGSILIAGQSIPVTEWGTAQIFNDVPPSVYYFDAVNLLKAKNITAGCGSNDFCPEYQITRSEAAIFLVRAAIGSDNFTASATPHFTDVAPTDFGFKWIQKLFELGITQGCGAGIFCPNSTVTRDTMAIFIVRMRLGPTANFYYPAAPYFTDVPINYFSYTWIQRLKYENITSGCALTLFCPTNPVTRGDMAIFIMRGGFNQLLPINTPAIASLSQNTLARGATATITVNGVSTNFAPGVTQLAPMPGVTVGALNVVSPTQLTVQLTAASGAVQQPDSVVAITGTEQAVLPNGLVIQ